MDPTYRYTNSNKQAIARQDQDRQWSITKLAAAYPRRGRLPQPPRIPAAADSGAGQAHKQVTRGQPATTWHLHEAPNTVEN
eukprot:2586182-Pyramimonas_sp.AAC.1